MRANRTKDEQCAINMVSRELEARDGRLTTDKAIKDKPDWVFDFNKVRVGAECVCINLEKLMKWSNSTQSLKFGRCYEVIFPNEPHLWVKKAIEEKEKKIESYIENSKADKIWLLLHSDLASPMALYECSDEMLKIMSLAASAINSRFDQIWFVHNERGAKKLWSKGDAVVPFPELIIDKEYPILKMKQGISRITKDGGVFSVCVENIEETIVIQPFDKRYTI